MNGSTTRRPPHDRMGLFLLLLLLLSLVTSPVTAASCTDASTLVEGQEDSTAIVYDAACNARSFQVVVSPTVERSLNLSNLDVAAVQSYPHVFQLLLNNNKLRTFAPIAEDNDMEDLGLANNYIVDLSDFNFPQRLNHLDLSSNLITTLPAATPWPKAGNLQTLLLHGNSLRSVSPTAFTSLVALQSLSLSSTGISNLDDLVLPASLRILNATQNSFTSASTNFSSLPTALQYLDLSNNLLTTFPSIVSSLTTLVELNLESNGITTISGVAFASTLRRVHLDKNPLSIIEICRSHVSVFKSLMEFTAPSSLSSTCSNPKAVSEIIQDVPFCILEDDDCTVGGSGSLDHTDYADLNEDSTSSDTGSANDSSSSSFSAESIAVIGSIFFFVGILMSVLGFSLLRKKRKHKDNGLSQPAILKVNRDGRLGSSGGNFMVFTSSGRANGYMNDDTDSKNGNNSTFGGSATNAFGEAPWGMYESPLDKYNPVALLEPSPKDKNYLGASTASLQARSKLKIKVDLDDLLVYEIPPEEIQMCRALHMSMSRMSSKAALALSSVGVGNSRRKMDSALFLAEYQGYKVVIHALLRSKKRLEKRFVEQIRLAASLDHASIVHFIGVTTGCSSTASRQLGSSVGTASGLTASYDSSKTLSESMLNNTSSRSRYLNMGAPSWHLGVVFEYMQHGSLADLFESERHRREGRDFNPANSVAAAIGSGTGNIFSWFPSFENSSASVNANPNADWRCKLSIALDVAMGLVYLHANNYAHGRVCARKVLMNEQGEAKLSAMDVLLPIDVASSRGREDGQGMVDDFRDSVRDSALWTVQKLTSLRASKAPKGSTSENFSRSRYANNSGESSISGVSSITLDENSSHVEETPVYDGKLGEFEEPTDEFDENSLKSSGIGSAIAAAQRNDVYAFGTFLWELDTMIAVEEDLANSRLAIGANGNPRLLQFSADCPMELQQLARQCWHDVPTERPDAIDVQEELVRVLEGRLTTSGQVAPGWARPSHLSSTSAISSLSSSEVSSNMSFLLS